MGDLLPGPATRFNAASTGDVPKFTKRTIFSARAHNYFVKLFNPFRHMRFAYGDSPRVVYSDSNIVLVIPNPSDAAQQAASTFKRMRICLPTDNSAQFNFGDYFWAQPWDGVNSGVKIPVAKYWHQRNSRTGRTYRGITSTFSYAYDGTYKDWTRTVHVTSPAATYDDETQLTDPPYVVGDEFYAADVSAGGGSGVSSAVDPMTGQPVAVTMVDMTPRNWCSVPVDPPP